MILREYLEIGVFVTYGRDIYSIQSLGAESFTALLMLTSGDLPIASPPRRFEYEELANFRPVSRYMERLYDRAKELRA